MYLLLFEFIICVRIFNSNCNPWNLITAYEKWLILPSIYFFSWPSSLLLSSFLALLTVWSQGCAPIVLLPSRNALATAPHWFLYYCSSHDDISHFVSSAVFPPLISIADYSASVSSDLMREPTELLLPSFTVIALCSPPAGWPGGSDSTERGAVNIIWGGGGNRQSDISAGGCDWQRTIQAHMGQSTNTEIFFLARTVQGTRLCSIEPGKHCKVLAHFWCSIWAVWLIWESGQILFRQASLSMQCMGRARGIGWLDEFMACQKVLVSRFRLEHSWSRATSRLPNDRAFFTFTAPVLGDKQDVWICHGSMLLIAHWSCTTGNFRITHNSLQVKMLKR